MKYYLHKWIFFIFCISTSFQVTAQIVKEVNKKPPPDVYTIMQKHPPVQLRYSPKDSTLVGMFSLKGKEILPFEYYNIMNYPVNESITDNIIFLLDTNNRRYQQMGFEVKPGYETKPQALTKGALLLYEPYWFDNGVDYFEEGRQRFVYDNTMGFVNRFGTVTVQAQYPYLESYKNGVTLACYDCVYKVLDSTDSEHCCGFSGKQWVLIDKNGKELKKINLKKDKRLYEYLPENPPPLTPNEKVLAAKLMALPELKRFAKDMEIQMTGMRMALYDKPFKNSPYYHFGLQDVAGSFNGNDYQFLITADGKTILHIDNTLQKVKTLAQWRKELNETNMLIDK